MNTEFRLLLGDECAERDPLLRDCAVINRRVSATKPILTGRWGTGKTAILLLQNAGLSSALKAVDESLERAWYVDEGTLDLQSLITLRERLAPGTSTVLHEQAFVRGLESVWRAEILRVFRQVLGALWKDYGSPAGAHWEFVLKHPPGRTGVALWRQLPAVLAEVLGGREAGGAVTQIEESVSDLFTETARTKLGRCLSDIRGHRLYPCVAIEPIETPASVIETGDHGLAQALITALLNVYNSEFAPGPANPFVVRISIPWHRFDIRGLDFPQKLLEYKGTVEWNRDDLRVFINRRIEWEFRRLKRPAGADPWADLFPAEIPNGLCEPTISEDSFRYFVRHTHHRARDLMRLVRTSIETEADARSESVDDVLRDRHNKVRVSSIKDNFRKVGLATTRELLNEGGRRYSDLFELDGLLKSMSQPFQIEDLKRRLAAGDSKITVMRAAHVLWETGVVGVTASPTTAEAARALTASLRDVARVSYKNKEGASFDRWTWFEYNWEGDLTDLVNKLGGFDQVSSGLVFHPKTFEHFSPSTSDRSCPIGS